MRSCSSYPPDATRLQQLLSTTQPMTSEVWSHDTDFEDTKQKTLAAVLAAKGKIRQEISELNEKLKG
jgi:YEATS domain-containing protein 4